MNADVGYLSECNVDESVEDSSSATTVVVDGVSCGSSASSVDTILDGETILNILLNNPEDFLLNTKPSAVRIDKVFTLNSEVISIESFKADDNGPYVYKGTTAKSYYYDAVDGVFIAHQFDDVLYFYNKGEGNKFSKEFVPRTKIYNVTRKYRQSKYIPGFNNTIARGGGGGVHPEWRDPGFCYFEWRDSGFGQNLGRESGFATSGVSGIKSAGNGISHNMRYRDLDYFAIFGGIQNPSSPKKQNSNTNIHSGPQLSSLHSWE